MKPGKHILVLRFSSMGDVAMTVPVIKAMLQQNADVHITVVSRPAFSGFFDGIERLNFFSVELKNDYKGIGGIIKLYRAIRDSRVYNAVADLHDTLRSKVLRTMFQLSGRPVAFIDKGRDEKKLLTRFPKKVLKPLKRTTERYADVFRKLGFPVVLEDQLVHQSEPLTDEFKVITGDKTQPWIGVTPFAQYNGKIFPLEKMEMVLAALEQQNVKVFLFGGTPMDKEICEGWEHKFNNVISTVRKLTMQQELALISNLNVMLSMDSAGMHLASLRGTPAVSIWGATHHYAGFLGYGQSEENIVADSIECRPCSIYGNKPCFRKDYACMHNINPQTVVDKLLTFA
jgi:ADP-heptose:LPS heptosyltransferase